VQCLDARTLPYFLPSEILTPILSKPKEAEALVMDNYATYKTAKIKAWLARRPHWHVHFTPTSAS
jgi:hypothetical protein